MEVIKQMKLLVNDKELAHYLITTLDLHSTCSKIEIGQRHTADAINGVIEKTKKSNFNLDKFRDKLKQKITRGVKKDLNEWVHKIKQQVVYYNQNHYKKIHDHLDYVISKVGEDVVIENYMNSKVDYFIKTVGIQLDPNAAMVRRKYFNDIYEDCLLRNTVGNEKILVDKIDNNLPFWFIDSGYTNFIEPNKKWHRLVRNHLHFNKTFEAPVDRLNNFATLPIPWKKEGKKILIIEPGPFAAGIFHVQTKSWGQQVEQELRKYTDRPIEIREKTNKKTRTSLYKKLLDEDYYCTVSINSNSAVESIWAGVPAITLDKHISNPVTVNSLDKVNELYTGSLGDWLAYLSYSQFTFEELMNGKAIEIIKRYHV